jgi:pimeloyl-ACP methyl ester carboxylesterase
LGRYSRWDAIRVLTDRAAILAPSLLLPYNKDKNPKGVKYLEITKPVLVMWGEKDNMMPPNQAYRFMWAIPQSRVSISRIPDAGHFAATDNPDVVAEEILNFITRELGRNSLADIFLGYTGLWKGDEDSLIKDLRSMYNM